jgi:hypothetical protein
MSAVHPQPAPTGGVVQQSPLHSAAEPEFEQIINRIGRSLATLRKKRASKTDHSHQFSTRRESHTVIMNRGDVAQ